MFSTFSLLSPFLESPPSQHPGFLFQGGRVEFTIPSFPSNFLGRNKKEKKKRKGYCEIGLEWKSLIFRRGTHSTRRTTLEMNKSRASSSSSSFFSIFGLLFTICPPRLIFPTLVLLILVDPVFSASGPRGRSGGGGGRGGRRGGGGGGDSGVRRRGDHGDAVGAVRGVCAAAAAAPPPPVVVVLRRKVRQRRGAVGGGQGRVIEPAGTY